MIASTTQPLRIYVIRHGETAWSQSGQHTGRTDIPLTDRGEQAAEALGTTLHDVVFAHVFTSPRLRATRTSELVALAATAQVDADLAEWDYGDHEGLQTPEIQRSDAAWNLFRDGCPNGESPAQVFARTQRLIARLRTLQGNVAVFTHGQFSSVFAALWIGLPLIAAEHLELGTAAFAILGYAAHHPDVAVISRWNVTATQQCPPAKPAQRTPLSATRQPAPGPTEKANERWDNEGGALVAEHDERTKRLIVFDLDGTLAESKAPIDAEMAMLLTKLLRVAQVAVISGGNWPQFQTQLVAHLPTAADLRSLSLLPTCGTKFYRFDDDWQLLYAEQFTAEQRTKILQALRTAMESEQLASSGDWGEVIEDRGTQITLSALGQQAPLAAKQQWDPDLQKRKRMQALLAQLIPEFSVRLGGTTSIDVTRPGVDKAYGIHKLRDLLGIAIDEMVFVGDALYPGGNDRPAMEAGVVSIQVRDSQETKRLIATMLAVQNGMAHVSVAAESR